MAQDALSPEAFEARLLEAKKNKRGGLYDLALQQLEALLPLTGSDPIWYSRCCNEFGECRRAKKHWDEAFRWHRRGEEALAKAPSGVERQRWLLMHLVNRGLAYLTRGMVEEAQQVLIDADRSGIDGIDVRELHEIRTILELRVMRLLDQTAGVRRTLQTFEARFSPDRLLKALAALAILQDPATTPTGHAEVAGWLDDAVAKHTGQDYGDMARALRILQRLNHGQHDEAAAAIAAADAVFSKDPANERRLALSALALRHAHDAGAHEAEVRSRHDALLRGWRLRLEGVAATSVVPGGVGLLFEFELLRGLEQLMRTHIRFDGEQGPALALERLLEVERLGTMARTVAAPDVSVGAVQSRLAVGGRGLLVYVPGMEGTWLFTIDAQSIRAHRLPVTVLQVERLARELRLAIDAQRNGSPAGLRAAEQALADALLPPAVAAAMAGWSRVAVCGGERTGYVPFELLRLPDGRRLGAALPVSYLPSLVVGAWLSGRMPPATERPLRTLLVACPDASPAIPGAQPVQSLPFGKTELATLTGRATRAEAAVLTGSNSDRASIRAHLDGVHLVSFLAHGMRDDARVDRQGLLLGDGSILWGADLESLPLPPWVFVGACRAGDGRARRGDDGRHHLSGAALLAGARAAIVPSLEVAYRPTMDLLAALSEAVRRGVPFDEGLRQARLAVAGDDGEGATDAFLFHLYGLGDEPLVGGEFVADSSPFRAWAVALVAVGLLVVGWRVRRKPVKREAA